MKKIVCLILACILCFCLCSCNNAKNSSTADTSNTEQDVTYSTVEDWVPAALLKKLDYMSDTIDIKQTRYEVASIESDEDSVGKPILVAYGNFSTYKKTGKFYKTGTFELKFSYSGELRDDSHCRSRINFD